MPTNLTLTTIAASTIALAATASAQTTGTRAVAPPDAQPTERQPLDWQSLEQNVLTNHVQLTFPEQFTRAGEAYFSPDGNWIIFQATEVPEQGQQPSPHYAMFVAKLIVDPDGIPVGIQEPIKISPPGSANTCGWFHPTQPWKVIYGSTLVPPQAQDAPGYQRGTGRYTWQFPKEMEIVTQSVQAIFDERNADLNVRLQLSPELTEPQPLLKRPGGYDAECAYDKFGLNIIFCSIDPETQDGDLYAFNTRTKVVTPIIIEEGYDGGPFFSPDAMRICYRSDRQGNNLLQLFVADLERDPAGNITGVKREIQLTNNRHVNWAPFWHPSGDFLVYSTSQAGHDNYEVFAIRVPPLDANPEDTNKRPFRITHATGFDGLPVFSNDGRYMMWTSQRAGPFNNPQQRPTSQVWIATFKPTNDAAQFIGAQSTTDTNPKPATPPNSP